MAPVHLSMFSHLTSSDWAPWVQAFGAIGAAAVALCVVWLRPGAALKARQKTLLAIAEAGLVRAKQTGEVVARPDPLNISDVLYVIYHQTNLDRIVKALTNLPAHEIGSRDAVMALLSLRDQFRLLGTSIEIFETPIKDPVAVKRLLELDEAERRQYLTGQQPILAKNVRDRLATIQRDYEALARALHHSAVPAKSRPWRGVLWIATSFFIVMIIVAAMAGRATARQPGADEVRIDTASQKEPRG
jgi:hypothetical protein